MFIKKLIINGFKSFADKTVIEFKDGVNVIIGPNGCGKSNIIESIRWVLGEQRMKAFRAEKSEDVIFAGTENRQASSYAEVTFHLNNDPKLLNLDMPEVLVSRKLFRSGESLYYMNKKECRLKDLQSLFLDTGIGKNSYSIIQQGQIDQILSSKTDERRMIFEEAAGIARSKILIKETEQKLLKTLENLARLTDILTEVKKQMDALKSQAEKAMEYSSLKKSIAENDKKIFGGKYRKIMADINEYNEKGKVFEEKIKQMRAEMQSIYDEIENSSSEISLAEEKQSNLREDEKKLEMEEYRLNSQITTLKGEHERLKKLFKKISEEIEFHQKRKEEMETFLASQQSVEDELDSKIEGHESEQDQLTAQLVELEEQIQDISGKIIRIRENNQAMDREVSSLLKKQKETFAMLMNTLETKRQTISANLKEKNQLKEKIGSYFVKLDGFIKKWEFAISSDTLSTQSAEISADLKKFFESMKNFKSDYIHYESEIQEILNFFEKEGQTLFSEEYDHQIQSIRNRIELGQDELAHLEKELENKRKTRDTVIRVSSDNKVSLNQVKEKKLALLNERDKTKKETASIGQTIQSKKNEATDTEIEMENTESEIFQMIDAYESTRTKREKISKEYQACNAMILEKTKSLREMENMQKEISGEIDKISKRMEKIVLEYKENLIRKDMLETSYYDKYLKQISEIDLNSLGNVDERKLELENNDSRNRLEQIGNVNLLAIDEYNEIKDRFEHLDKQRQDMESSRADLKKLMEDVNRQATDSFMEVFSQIEKNFQTIFTKAFNGGKCQLQLEDPAKPLESGIEIIAQPPGKKLQSIFLLSGGEKAMTALSIMFAIFMIRPAPFCLLDEVDAPLDEANVERFTKIIDQFTDKTQFVIITHNRLTAQTGDIFYGITMQEKGVTKVFSYKPENINTEINLN